MARARPPRPPPIMATLIGFEDESDEGDIFGEGVERCFLISREHREVQYNNVRYSVDC